MKTIDIGKSFHICENLYTNNTFCIAISYLDVYSLLKVILSHCELFPRLINIYQSCSKSLRFGSWVNSITMFRKFLRINVCIREPNKINEYYYFILNLETIVLIANEIINFFRCKDRKWYCDSCGCEQKNVFKEIFASFSTNLPMENTIVCRLCNHIEQTHTHRS